MSYYVVTGSNGMIGGQLLEYLDSTRKNTRSFNKSDIDSCDNQEILIKKIDELIKYSNGVFHVGAIADTSDFSADVMYYNYHITKLIADSCFRWNKKLIFSSTQMTVGRKELGYPENIYGWSKVACEDYIYAKRIQKLFSNDYFRVYTSTDVIGIEFGGSIKNIIATTCTAPATI